MTKYILRLSVLQDLYRISFGTYLREPKIYHHLEYFIRIEVVGCGGLSDWEELVWAVTMKKI